MAALVALITLVLPMASLDADGAEVLVERLVLPVLAAKSLGRRLVLSLTYTGHFFKCMLVSRRPFFSSQVSVFCFPHFRTPAIREPSSLLPSHPLDGENLGLENARVRGAGRWLTGDCPISWVGDWVSAVHVRRRWHARRPAAAPEVCRNGPLQVGVWQDRPEATDQGSFGEQAGRL